MAIFTNSDKIQKYLEQYGIYKEQQELYKIIQGAEEKMITKTYNYFLRFKMEEETVKETMIIWANFFRYNIELEHWEKLWGKITN